MSNKLVHFCFAGNTNLRNQIALYRPFHVDFKIAGASRWISLLSESG